MIVNAHFKLIEAMRGAKRGGAAMWDGRDDAFLITHYELAPWSLLRRTLQTRTQSAIRQRASRLGLVRRHLGKPAWTTGEERVLRAMFSTDAWRDIERALPRRSRSAINQHAIAMGLRRPPRTKLRARYVLLRGLAERRRKLRHTRAGLAALIGVTKCQVERWEFGLNVPRFPMLLDWAEALGLELVLREKGDAA